MKNKLGKKGFTLVELLAVIVVLAIIMVIATTQINGTIKKSRGDSFYDSVLMIEKNAKLLCTQNDDKITVDDLKDASDIAKTNDANYNITASTDKASVIIKGIGKFNNMTLPGTYKTGITKTADDTLTLALPSGCVFE